MNAPTPPTTSPQNPKTPTPKIPSPHGARPGRGRPPTRERTRVTTAKDKPTFRLPDRPEREPDDMTSYRQLTAPSIIEPLRHYLGNLETTLMTGDHYLCRTIAPNLAGSRYPDLLIAFNADIEAYQRSNGYIIAEQGKPPDFVLEIASHSTGSEDVGDKRDDYADFGIPEYWRFDETANGSWHGNRLAGDRLINGTYQPIPIAQLPGGILQGYSPILNLLMRWENGQLRWHNPQTGEHIATFATERRRADREREARLRAEVRVEDERVRAVRAEVRAEDERVRADRAEVRAENAESRAENAEVRAENAESHAASEREARLQAETLVRELNARLKRIGDQ